MALSRLRQLQSRPRVLITEEPDSCKLRFRYPSEGISGSILGASSRPENPTFPAIKILGYTGLVRIIVSCVTKDEPYRAHPHKVVGREHCQNGVFCFCTEITAKNNEYQFRHLAIQCVKRCEVGEALRIREEMAIDPFNTGFSHRKSLQCIDMSAVRLAIQVHLMYPSGTVLNLQPVVSRVIYDKKSVGQLCISYPSACSGPARGGTRVTVLCEKIVSKKIVVVFYRDDENVWWEQEARIKRVHKQVAIVFDTPPYLYPNTTNKVKVQFQLRRLSDGAASNPLPYIYYPNLDVPTYIDSKKRKILKTSLIGSFCKQNSRARQQYPSASPLLHPFSRVDQDTGATSMKHSQGRLVPHSSASHPMYSCALCEDTLYSGTSPAARPIRTSTTLVDISLNSVASSSANLICSGPSSVDTAYSAMSQSARPIHNSTTLVDISLNSVASSSANLICSGPSSVDTSYSPMSPSARPIHNSTTLVDISLNSVASSSANLICSGPSSVDTSYSPMSPSARPIHNSTTLVDISLNSVASSSANLICSWPSSVDTSYSPMSPSARPIHNSTTLVDISLNSVASSSANLICSGPSSVDTSYSPMSPSARPIHNSTTLVDISLNSVASSSANLTCSGPSSVDTSYSPMSPSARPIHNSTTLVDISLNSVASSSANLICSGPSSVDTSYSAMSLTARPIHNSQSFVSSTTLDGESLNWQTDYIQQADTWETSQSVPATQLPRDLNQLLEVIMRNYPDILDDDDNDLLINLDDDNPSCDSQND